MHINMNTSINPTTNNQITLIIPSAVLIFNVQMIIKRIQTRVHLQVIFVYLYYIPVLFTYSNPYFYSK